jgi:hypothetical protein
MAELFNVFIVGGAAMAAGALAVQPVSTITSPQPSRSVDIFGVTPHPELLVRADFGDTNCGYINGNLQQPLNCQSGYDCTHDGAASVSGCCATASTSNCVLDTTCLDYGNQQSVLRALTCDESNPICTTGFFVDGYAFFTCGPGSQATQASAFYHAVSSVDVPSSASVQPTDNGATGGTGDNAATGGRESNGASGGAGNSGSGSGTDTTPYGPIVGGVVGGLGVLIFGVLVIWFIRRKGRTNQKEDEVSKVDQPPSSDGQSHSNCASDEKRYPTVEMEAQESAYSELPAPPAELSNSQMSYAHEAAGEPAHPTEVGRSELPDSRSYIG